MVVKQIDVIPDMAPIICAQLVEHEKSRAQVWRTETVVWTRPISNELFFDGSLA